MPRVVARCLAILKLYQLKGKKFLRLLVLFEPCLNVVRERIVISIRRQWNSRKLHFRSGFGRPSKGRGPYNAKKTTCIIFRTLIEYSGLEIPNLLLAPHSSLLPKKGLAENIF